MSKYSVKELAELAGVSVRTLHHYDQIDLLKPSYRSEKGYRFYERKELLLLQQILFYRKLGLTLADIDAIINDSSFNLINALESHKKNLKKELGDLKRLIKTIDNTLNELKNNEIMKDHEIYEGFTTDEMKSIREEVTDRWGEEQLLATEERIRKMGKEGWENTKQKGEEINKLLADVMHLPPEHINVQKAIQLHFTHMNLFYEVSKERYSALGKMYVDDKRFTATYDKYSLGLASFINEAIQIFCQNNLQVNSKL